jgi:hypothetical protein
MKALHTKQEKKASKNLRNLRKNKRLLWIDKEEEKG